MHINKELIDRLAEKYGRNIDIAANPSILQSILRDVQAANKIKKFGDISQAAGHDKTYTQSVPGDWDYVKYDKTESGFGHDPKKILDPKIITPGLDPQILHPEITTPPTRKNNLTTPDKGEGEF
ncbi:hypothetical protein F6Y02_41170 (plasmid) [Bacillus megaterium]|nr:hypothetical protein [Priestia megaterium]